MIVNVHYYEEMAPDPKSHQVLFIAIWQPVAELYKSYPNGLLFEPMNKPNGAIVASVWNGLLVATLPAIRSTNPTRNIVIGAADWTGLFFLRTINT